jgi:hypothetical protein
MLRSLAWVSSVFLADCGPIGRIVSLAYGNTLPNKPVLRNEADSSASDSDVASDTKPITS